MPLRNIKKWQETKKTITLDSKKRKLGEQDLE